MATRNDEMAMKIANGPEHDAECVDAAMCGSHDGDAKIMQLRAQLKPDGQSKSTVNPIRSSK